MKTVFLLWHPFGKRRFVALTILLLLLSHPWNCAAQTRSILVYTRNQVGTNLYVHDNIAAASSALKEIAAEAGFAVEVSEDPAIFSDEKLAKFGVIVFNNTNNEVLETEAQKSALQRFIRRGGGFVGIHSASGSMRQWPWFWSMLGGKFRRHPKLQTFTVKVKDREDISTRHFPPEFQWTDEFYYVDHMPEGLHVLLAGDLLKLDDPEKSKYPGDAFGSEFPLAWRHEFEGGRAWYTALGHKPEHYSNPNLRRHLLGGIRWAIGGN